MRERGIHALSVMYTQIKINNRGIFIMEKIILDVLADNARLSSDQIAYMTGYTKQQVEETIVALQKKGIIKGFKAIIDWDKTDTEICVARIELRVAPKTNRSEERRVGKEC